MIATTLVDPIVQSIVTYPDLRLEAGQSSIRRVQTWNFSFIGTLTDPNEDPGFLDASMSMAVYQALFRNPDRPGYVCPTGDCTWDRPVTSLSLCSSCEDVSTKIQPSASAFGGSAMYFLSNGLSLRCAYISYSQLNSHCHKSLPIQVPAQVMTARGSGNISNSGHENFMVAVSIMTQSQAYECTIYPCVKEYNVSVLNGVFNEALITTWHGFNNSRRGTGNDSVRILTFSLPSSEHD